MSDNYLETIKTFLDKIPMCTVIYRYVNNDFIFIDFNKMTEKTEKISKDEIIGKVLTEVFPKVKEFGLFDLLVKVYETGVEEELSVRFYEDERVSGWRHNIINRLENGDILVTYSDVSEKKESEKREQRLTKLLDSSETVVFYWRAEENWPVEYVSSNITSFGYSQEEFLEGKIHYSDIIHPDDIKKVSEEVVKYTNNNRDRFSQIYRIVTSDGRVRWIDDRTVIERDSKGVPTNYLGTIIDITEHKEVENHLYSLGSIVDNSLNEIYIFDAKSLNFTYLNSAAEKNIAYTLEEIKQISPVDILPEYNRFKFINFIAPLLNNSEEFLLFETLYQRKDFSTYDVEIRLQLMELDGKKQFVAVAQNISEYKNGVRQLEESEEKFKNISENALMGIFIYQEKYVYVNDAFADALEYSKNELYNLQPWKVVANKSVEEEMKKVVRERLRGKKFSKSYNDIHMITKNGQVKIMRVTTQTIKYRDRYAGMGTLIDITDIVNTKNKLKLLGQAIGQMDEMVKITDKKGTITYVNEALVAHSGYRELELIGANSSIFKSKKQDTTFYKKLWNTISSGKVYRNIIVNRKKDGTYYHEEITITPILDSKGVIQNYVSTGKDITQRVMMEEKLHTLATRDSLTGIYNRHMINEEIDNQINREERYHRSFGLLMLDIDHFKAVNDTYGHDVGDYVLKELSTCVTHSIRESDMFGRWGGEEFMLILPEINKKDLIKSADKLRSAIASYSFKDIFQITVSIGATIFNADTTKAELIKHVDNALYQAKERGRNRVVFWESH